MDEFKCPRCGKTISEDAEKCPKCGIAADNGSTEAKQALANLKRHKPGK